MAKLIVMRGLPACGKSTRAKELLKTDGNAVRLNRDLLREMLHFNKWSGKKERMTIDAQITLVEFFLENEGKNVIIDDTNLHPPTFEAWKQLAKKLDHSFEVINMRDVTWQECVSRDQTRQARGERFVGKSVIINMARQFGLYKYDKPDIICDIDGTLCDISHRLHFVKGTEKKDWSAFFKALLDDKPRPDIISRVQDLSIDHNIVLVSGRPGDHKEATIKWLRDNGVSYHTLIMRHEGDKRDDNIVKKQILDTYWPGEAKSQIKLVIDDRPRVIRMWRENGLEVMDVGKGIEF